MKVAAGSLAHGKALRSERTLSSIADSISQHPFLMFAALTALYLITGARNHFEALDGAAYAMTAEETPITSITDSRSILFHAFNRASLLTMRLIWPSLSAYTWISILTAMAGAGAAVLLHRLLRRHFSVSPGAALAGAGMLAFSYGLWRYSGEVELYAPSTFLILATLNLLFDADARPEARWTASLPAAVMAAVSVLYYQPNVLPLFFAITVFLVSRRRFSWMLAYGALGTTLVLGGIAFAAGLDLGRVPTLHDVLAFAFSRSNEFLAEPLPLRDFLIAPLRRLHLIASSHWLYAFDFATRETLQADPGRWIGPKLLAVNSAKPLVYLAAFTFIGLIVTAIAIVVAAIRAGGLWARLKERRVLYLVAALGLTSAINIGIDPNSNEPAIMELWSLSALAAIFVFDPCCRAGRETLVAAFIGLLFSHNLFGGQAIWWRQSGDIYAQQTAWLARNATPNDVVLFGENNGGRGLVYYVRCHRGLNVMLLSSGGDTQDFGGVIMRAPIDPAGLEAVQKRGGHIYFLQSLFDPPLPIFSPRYQQQLAAQTFGNSLQPLSRVVNESPFGNTYELMRIPK